MNRTIIIIQVWGWRRRSEVLDKKFQTHGEEDSEQVLTFGLDGRD